MHDVIVIGGGVIGLSIARELRADGTRSVLVLDRGEMGESASWAAAGMLTPQSEADDQGHFFQLGMASLRVYRAFVDGLTRETGLDTEFATGGLIYVASTEEAFDVMKRRYESQRQAKLNVELLSPDEVCKREPLVTLPVLGGLFFPDDLQVSPRRLVDALRASCVRRGVEIRTGTQVDAVSEHAVRAGSEEWSAESIIVASGVWSSKIRGLDPPIPLRPRKGQILSLKMPGPTFRHMIRWEHAYFVPRPCEELVVGATDEDAGFDRSLTPAGIGRLLANAQQISSHVASYPIREMWSGLRPAAPDGLPIIGSSAIPDVYYATGHYRNGVLLAPVTASIVSALLDRRDPRLDIGAYSPARFAHRNGL